MLSAELHQWGYYSLDLSGTVSVEPIDPTKPFEAAEIDFDWVSGPCPSVLYTGGYCDPGSRHFDNVDTNYGEAWGDALEHGWPLDATAPFVAIALWGGRGLHDGVNSVTTETNTFRVVDAAAFYNLDITYEAPIPEPGTASFFLAGAIGLFVLRRTLRKRPAAPAPRVVRSLI